MKWSLSADQIGALRCMTVELGGCSLLYIIEAQYRDGSAALPHSESQSQEIKVYGADINIKLFMIKLKGHTSRLLNIVMHRQMLVHNATKTSRTLPYISNIVNLSRASPDKST